MCLCSCSSWGCACQGPKHVEDSNVTYVVIELCIKVGWRNNPILWCTVEKTSNFDPCFIQEDLSVSHSPSTSKSAFRQQNTSLTYIFLFYHTSLGSSLLPFRLCYKTFVRGEGASWSRWQGIYYRRLYSCWKLDNQAASNAPLMRQTDRQTRIQKAI